MILDGGILVTNLAPPRRKQPDIGVQNVELPVVFFFQLIKKLPRITIKFLPRFGALLLYIVFGQGDQIQGERSIILNRNIRDPRIGSGAFAALRGVV